MVRTFLGSNNSVLSKKLSAVNSLNNTSRGMSVAREIIFGKEGALRIAEREYVNYGRGGVGQFED